MFNLSNNDFMKTLRFLLIFVLVASGLPVLSQNPILPGIDLYTLEGSTISAASIGTNERMLVLLFWNADDNKSLERLRLLNDEKNTFGEKIKIVGICTNYSCTMQSIRPLVSGLAIDFDIYIDRNNDLKRAMNIPYIPYTMIVGPTMDVHRYSAYCNNLVETIIELNNTGLANISNKR